MKRKALLAVLLASACLMAGCSSSKKETEAPAKAETEAKTEAVKQEEAATEAAAAIEEAATEAAAAAEEAATEAAAAIEEAATEAAAAIEEAATEAAEVSSEVEAAIEEAISEAEALAVEEAISEAEAVAEEVLSEEEATEAAVILEETEVEEAAVEDIAGVASETEEATEAVSEEAATEAAVEEAATEAAEETEESALEEAVEETEAVEEATEALEGETESAGAVIVELGERPEYKALDYVTVGTYKGLMAEVTKTDISDADVEGEMNIDLEMAVEEKALFEQVKEGTVADGDIVNIDYEGKIDGVAFDGGTGNYDLEIGSGSFIPGFEEQLVGMNVGDTIDINVTFPDSYYEELAGKEAVFTVTANYIKKTPETTDELVSKATDGEYETIEDYLAYEKQKLTDQAEESKKSEAFNELMTQLFNTFTINSIPEDLVDYSLGSARNQYIQMAQMYGMTYEDMIASYGVDQTTFEGYLKDDIESSLKQEMILNAIAETENLTLSDEEYKEGAQRYADTYGYESVESFEEAYPQGDIRKSLLMNKVMEFVYDNAVITEVEPEAETDELVLAEAETEIVVEEDLVDETETETETETEAK